MDSAIKKANDRLSFLSIDKEFLHQVHLREIALSDYTTAINDAKDEGKIETQIVIAKNLIKIGLSDSQISEGTGLSTEEIESLRND